MALINLDFSNLSASSGVENHEPLEPGWYSATIDSVVEKTSKSGNPMLQFVFLIETDANGDYVSGIRRVYTYCMLTPDMLWKLQNVLACLDVQTDSIVELDTDSLLGLAIGLKLVQSEYAGRMQNDIKEFKNVSDI